MNIAFYCVYGIRLKICPALHVSPSVRQTPSSREMINPRNAEYFLPLWNMHSDLALSVSIVCHHGPQAELVYAG